MHSRGGFGRGGDLCPTQSSQRRASSPLKSRSQEDTLDAALAGQARLLGSLLEARSANNVPAKFGAAALERAFDAIGHGRMLRESMLAVHRELAGVNLREVGVGDTVPCPEEGFSGLSLVASRQSEAA